MRDTVDEVGGVAAAEGIDCDWAKGGTVAPGPHRRPAGAGARLTSPRPAAGRHRQAAGSGRGRGHRAGGRQPVLGGGVHPGLRPGPPAPAGPTGWPRAVERRGGTVHEGPPRPRSSPDAACALDRRRTVAAPQVIRATEAWTPACPGTRRDVVPVYSLMVATGPLPAEFWAEVGLAARRDLHRPPAPDRLRPAHRRRPARLRRPRRALPLRLADPARVRPRGDGVRRPARDPAPTCSRSSPDAFTPRLGRAAGHPPGLAPVGRPDPATGLGWAGGYVGDGVAATNLAGRTLADLVTGRATPR